LNRKQHSACLGDDFGVKRRVRRVRLVRLVTIGCLRLVMILSYSTRVAARKIQLRTRHTSDMDSAAQAHGPQIKLAAESTVQKPLALSISDSDLELMN
jgi:hypothetical protein